MIPIHRIHLKPKLAEWVNKETVTINYAWKYHFGILFLGFVVYSSSMGKKQNHTKYTEADILSMSEELLKDVSLRNRSKTALIKTLLNQLWAGAVTTKRIHEIGRAHV